MQVCTKDTQMGFGKVYTKFPGFNKFYGGDRSRPEDKKFWDFMDSEIGGGFEDDSVSIEIKARKSHKDYVLYKYVACIHYDGRLADEPDFQMREVIIPRADNVEPSYHEPEATEDAIPEITITNLPIIRKTFHSTIEMGNATNLVRDTFAAFTKLSDDSKKLIMLSEDLESAFLNMGGERFEHAFIRYKELFSSLDAKGTDFNLIPQSVSLNTFGNLYFDIRCGQFVMNVTDYTFSTFSIPNNFYARSPLISHYDIVKKDIFKVQIRNLDGRPELYPPLGRFAGLLGVQYRNGDVQGLQNCFALGKIAFGLAHLDRAKMNTRDR